MNASQIGTEVRIALRQVTPPFKTLEPGIHSISKKLGVTGQVSVGKGYSQRQPNKILTRRAFALALSMMSEKQANAFARRLSAISRDGGLFAKIPKEYAVKAVNQICDTTVTPHNGKKVSYGVVEEITV